MGKKKLEVVELDKEKEKIVLEEKDTPFLLFWKKYRNLIFLIALIFSLTFLMVSLFITISNLSKSEVPMIKEVSVDVNLNDANVVVDPSTPITDETAKNTFDNNGKFKNRGEVLLVKIVETGKYTLKFYSDYTALKIMKDGTLITRIGSINDNTYGIAENGVINTKAITSEVELINIKKYSWGNVNYYSDGSADIINSNMDMFVRNAKDIKDNYISKNKVSYVKENKNINGIKLTYYYDGTILVVTNGKSYLVRDINDLKIENNKVSFNNGNEAVIKESKKLDDGRIIDYYTDGGAIIYDGSRSISVRKSNSIVIKNNKIFEIVDNIYVTISKTMDNGNVIYYTNGGAVINDYNGKTIYVHENSDIKYSNGKIVSIGNNYEVLTEKREINNDKISKFETVAVVETDEYIAIVPKDNIIYDSDGSLKDILDNEIDSENKPIEITNSTNEKIRYRLVLERSNRTNLDTQYIKYQLSVSDNYMGPKRLNENIWNDDEMANVLGIKGTNYILLDKTLEPGMTDKIKLMLWTDYDTIPNSMQDKYFYGTLRVYSFTEINNK